MRETSFPHIVRAFPLFFIFYCDCDTVPGLLCILSIASIMRFFSLFASLILSIWRFRTDQYKFIKIRDVCQYSSKKKAYSRKTRVARMVEILEKLSTQKAEYFFA